MSYIDEVTQRLIKAMSTLTPKEIYNLYCQLRDLENGGMK